MSATTRRLRTLAIDKAFGGGLAGFAASAAIGWAVDQLRKVGDPVTIEVADLRPGERYVVSTRPAMGRAERRLYKKRHKAQRKLDAATRPSRSTIRTAKKLAKAQRRQDTRREGTRRQARATARAERYGARFDAKTAPNRRVAKLQRKVDRYEAQLAPYREAALAKARRRRRVPRTRTYR